MKAEETINGQVKLTPTNDNEQALIKKILEREVLAVRRDHTIEIEENPSPKKKKNKKNRTSIIIYLRDPKAWAYENKIS